MAAVVAVHKDVEGRGEGSVSNETITNEAGFTQHHDVTQAQREARGERDRGWAVATVTTHGDWRGPRRAHTRRVCACRPTQSSEKRFLKGKRYTQRETTNNKQRSLKTHTEREKAKKTHYNARAKVSCAIAMEPAQHRWALYSLKNKAEAKQQSKPNDKRILPTTTGDNWQQPLD